MEDVASSVPHGNRKETTYKLEVGRVASTTKGSRQTNTFGKKPAVGIATEVRITEVYAEGGGTQTNHF
jgi:hypothetical protein